MEFTPGTCGENDWEKGESACVDRAFYVLPNGSEYAIFKFCERTMTGRKKLRWWHIITDNFTTTIFAGLTRLFPVLKMRLLSSGLAGSGRITWFTNTR